VLEAALLDGSAGAGVDGEHVANIAVQRLASILVLAQLLGALADLPPDRFSARNRLT
jgi:hypothetical protein